MQILIKIIKRVTLVLINVLVLIISFMIPKSNKIAIVGGWFGQRFADNSKYFYLYLNDNLKSLGFDKVVWITRSEEIKDELTEQGYQVYFTWSLKSIWYHLRAGFHIIDQSAKDINAFFSVRSKRINLWHGFPLKKVGTFMGGLAYSDRSSLGKLLSKITSRGFWADHYVLATSEFAAEIQGKIFGLVDEKVIISGYPRNYESFVSCPIKFVPDKELNLLKEIENYKEMGYKIIGYFPTFRDKRETLIFGTNDTSLQVEFLDFCELLKLKVVGKFHFAGKNDKTGQINNHEAFIKLDPDADVYTFINDIDILITDYSSIFYDFLLWERPIIFFPYDLEYYRDQDRGLMFDYDEYTPGPKVRNLNELKEVLKNPDFEQIYSNEYSKSARELSKKVFANYKEMDINHLVNEIRKI